MHRRLYFPTKLHKKHFYFLNTPKSERERKNEEREREYRRRERSERENKEKGSSQFSDSESFLQEIWKETELENAKQEFEAMVLEAPWV